MPGFRESYELPEGLYRRSVPAFDDKVLRELLVNALVHRPYIQRGDIFLNLHPSADALKPWLGRLLALELVRTTGRTKATRYFVDPALLRGAKVPTVTTLARIEPHRLRALILEDLARYPGSASSEINGRVGPELAVKTIKRALDELAAAGQVAHEGERRWRRYRLGSKGQATAESTAGR